MDEAYIPTPEEIAEECRRIREGWTVETERSRRVIGPREWVVPGTREAPVTLRTGRAEN